MVDAIFLIAASNSNSLRELVGRYLRLLFVAFTILSAPPRRWGASEGITDQEIYGQVAWISLRSFIEKLVFSDSMIVFWLLVTFLPASVVILLGRLLSPNTVLRAVVTALAEKFSTSWR